MPWFKVIFILEIPKALIFFELVGVPWLGLSLFINLARINLSLFYVTIDYDLMSYPCKNPEQNDI